MEIIETKEKTLDSNYTIVCLSKKLAEFFEQLGFKVYLLKLKRYTKSEFRNVDKKLSALGAQKKFTRTKKIYYILPEGVELNL